VEEVVIGSNLVNMVTAGAAGFDDWLDLLVSIDVNNRLLAVLADALRGDLPEIPKLGLALSDAPQASPIGRNKHIVARPSPVRKGPMPATTLA
jgi:hypothetical protein